MARRAARRPVPDLESAGFRAQHRLPANPLDAARERLVERLGEAVGALGLDQPVDAARAHADGDGAAACVADLAQIVLIAGGAECSRLPGRWR